VATEIFRDHHLLVVDKPAGVATQADKNGQPGLYDALRADDPTLALHHRLDRPASGLVVFGRSGKANKSLADGFRTHAIQRTYVAILVGEAVSGTWDAPIDGKTARSDVTVLHSANGFTAVSMSLHTGRTHQLRRHAAMNGTPIAGDRRYGGSASRAWGRLALHAATLSLKHPEPRARPTIESPLPDDMAAHWALAQ
jgi:23S rRNA-/tRNA-specific pseudouridylate synthase